MNPTDVFNQVKDFVTKQDFEGAKQFIEEHKDDLGEYLEQTKDLLKGNETVSNAIDGLKNLLG